MRKVGRGMRVGVDRERRCTMASPSSKQLAGCGRCYRLLFACLHPNVSGVDFCVSTSLTGTAWSAPHSLSLSRVWESTRSLGIATVYVSLTANISSSCAAHSLHGFRTNLDGQAAKTTPSIFPAWGADVSPCVVPVCRPI